jgi:hypothetical protein
MGEFCIEVNDSIGEPLILTSAAFSLGIDKIKLFLTLG